MWAWVRELLGRTSDGKKMRRKSEISKATGIVGSWATDSAASECSAAFSGSSVVIVPAAQPLPPLPLAAHTQFLFFERHCKISSSTCPNTVRSEFPHYCLLPYLPLQRTRTDLRGTEFFNMIHARATAAVGALALALAAAAADATVADCSPLDLVNFNLTDYIRYSATSDFL